MGFTPQKSVSIMWDATHGLETINTAGHLYFFDSPRSRALLGIDSVSLRLDEGPQVEPRLVVSAQAVLGEWVENVQSWSYLQFCDFLFRESFCSLVSHMSVLTYVEFFFAEDGERIAFLTLQSPLTAGHHGHVSAILTHDTLAASEAAYGSIERLIGRRVEFLGRLTFTRPSIPTAFQVHSLTPVPVF